MIQAVADPLWKALAPFQYFSQLATQRLNCGI